MHVILLALVAHVRGYSPGAWMPSLTPSPHCTSSVRACVQVNVADESRGFEGRIAEFAPRRELPSVRGQLAKLQEQLDIAVADEEYIVAAMLRDDLLELQSKDPAVMAASLREEMASHVKHERYPQAARCRDELRVLRRFLPQYQLAGLWKGNYPNHGDELVRLHYDSDVLYATKLTGDEHVPSGEVTFRADLATPFDVAEWSSGGSSGCGEEAVGVRVEVLSISSSGKHEPRQVEQFRGEGRIAARGFRYPHYVPGQLFLMDDDVIGFLWLPIGTFVVFSRVPEEQERSGETSAALAALGLPSAEMVQLDRLAEGIGGGELGESSKRVDGREPTNGDE